MSRRLPCLALGLMLAAPAAVAAEPPRGVAEVASATFVLGCAAHVGALDKLHDRLQPGGDLYLPRLPEAAAKPFLQGRPGEAYIRDEAGVTLALVPSDDQCAVFVRRVAANAINAQVEKDLKAAVGRYFTVQPGGRDTKGALTSRFIDLVPTQTYREELLKKHGREPSGLRVIVTTSESANPDLQAIITIGLREP
ncbi:hypothetical protein [Magnetospirillum sp. 15-1]|uniref:NMCC_0638 family (lipo)protein n=1 Tax=Magnetospirillum sp. 15-1 TaxID=1979370 RepID=UPI001F5BA87D|nr:hypothetical protein [Magnetospirillum sp. 15-1]